MATTDTRSGFRLPWSSDRSHDDQHEGSVDDAAATAALDKAPGSDGSASTAPGGWPEAGAASRLGASTQPSVPADQAEVPTSAEEPQVMAVPVSIQASTATSAPRKPSRLIAELAAAMRATAETAREQALSQVEADAAQAVEAIRAGSTEGTAELRHRADEDIAGIRDWSKTEIARIREETDRRISERKTTLEAQVSGHAAAIERRIEEVQKTVSAYEMEMTEFFERLLGESDPGRLATMAESMPEPPSLVPWTDTDGDDATAEAVASVADETTDAEDAVGTTDATAETPAEAETQAETEAVSGTADGWGSTDADSPSATDADPPEGDTAREAESAWPTGYTADDAGGAWGPTSGAATTAATGEPPDREAIMAALEAAAEAVGAAEAAAASADQAEVAADLAETAAELLVGRVDGDEDSFDPGNDPDAEAAIAARLDAFGSTPEPTLADRLASFLPSATAGADDGEPVTTQVVVTGLVSVASIASFKRHLGRIAGVQSVSVSSGPDGEFMFSATHRPDVSFRDVVPHLPGFAARVTGSGDGVVHVTARDPETEG